MGFNIVIARSEATRQSIFLSFPMLVKQAQPGNNHPKMDCRVACGS